MTQYVKHHTTKHERDRALRQRAHLRPFNIYELAITAAQFSNPVAPPQHDHTAQLDAWADHVARGYIVR